MLHRSLMTAVLAAGLVGSMGLAAFSQTPDGSRSHHGRGPRVDLAATAAQLGVSEANLKEALGLPAERPERPDIAAAAAQLGVNETSLREALRSAHEEAMEQRQAAGERPQRGGRGEVLASAAAQLGVSEANLRDALGLPAEPPSRPDLAAAAAQLGVSETDLQAALRSNMRARQPRGERPAAPAQ